MSVKSILCSLSAVAILVSSVAFAADEETAKYTVVESDGQFEIREYAELTVATTKSTQGSSGFMRLFRYISGENDPQTKI